MTKQLNTVEKLAAGALFAVALLTSAACVPLLAGTAAGVAVDEANEGDGEFDPAERVFDEDKDRAEPDAAPAEPEDYNERPRAR